MRSCVLLICGPLLWPMVGCQWIDGPALRPFQALADEFKPPIVVEQTPEDLGRELKDGDGRRQKAESNLAITNVTAPRPEPLPDPMFTTAAEPVKGSSPRAGEAAEVSDANSNRIVGWSLAAIIGSAIGWGISRIRRKEKTRGKRTTRRTTKR